MKLRAEYAEGNIVAGYIPSAPPTGVLAESGPSEVVDITNAKQIAEVVDKYHIDTIYNLAALLSAVAENKPQLAWHIGIDGLMNVLEVSRERNAPCSLQVLLALSVPTRQKTALHKTLFSSHAPCMA